MLSHTHKSVILLISLLIVGLSIVAVGDAKTLKLGHIIAPGSLTNKSYTEVFKPYVEKETNGEIKIEVFPSGQLGSAPDQLEGVAMGAQDMFSGDLTWWQVYAPRAGLPSIPFTFEDREHF